MCAHMLTTRESKVVGEELELDSNSPAAGAGLGRLLNNEMLVKCLLTTNPHKNIERRNKAKTVRT